MVKIQPAQARETNILTLDIERLPGLAEVWDQKNDFISVAKFQRLPATICFAAKRYGRHPVEFRSTWDDGFEAMIRRSWELYDAADIVVTYNGVRFDNKILRSDWRALGLGEPRPWKDVDLFAVNRAGFGRVSYSLQHLLTQLGHTGKAGHYDAAMAQRCLDGSATDQRKMRRYNVGDVRGTEWAYDELRGSMPRHPAMRPAAAGRTLSCNQCGGLELTDQGEYQAEVLIYPLFRCDHCGGNVVDRRSCGRVAYTRGVR